MAFDGTAFRALDDDVVDEGVNIDDNPLDVFLEQAHASNTRYLMSGYDSASVPFYGFDSDTSVTTGEKVFCSRNNGRALHYPILVTRGMESVSLTMCYACTAGDTEGTGVNCELRLARWNSSRTRGSAVATETFTLTSSSAYTETKRTVSLSGAWTGTPEVLYLELWIQGDDAGDTGSNLNADSVGTHTIGLNATISTPEQFVSRYIRSDDTGIDYDVLKVFADSNLKVEPDPQGLEDDDATYSIREVWYLNIRSTNVRCNYDGLIRSQAPSTEELRAQESIYATTSIPQISSTRRTYSAPRHIAFGPAGQESPEESSAQPWYLFTTNPTNEIIMDGVLQDAITGDDRLTVIVTWAIAGGNTPIDADVSVTAEWRILDDGDTAWSSATLIAQANSGVQSYSFPGSAETLISRSLEARGIEDVTAAQLCRDSIVYPNEPQQMATTIISNGVIQSTADSTRHSQPGRLSLTFTTDDASTPTGALNAIFVTGYAVIARAI